MSLAVSRERTMAGAAAKRQGMGDSSQFRLLRERRFLPYFGAQALGAFNDNLLKNALILVATFRTATYTQVDPEKMRITAGAAVPADVATPELLRERVLALS